jgi:transcriptional regulator with XRE-family HTH domain
METKDDKLAREFGDRLRELRTRAELTLRELGARVVPPMHFQAVARYEKGKRAPTLTLLYRLAKALACTPCDLLPAGTELPGPAAARPRGRRT